MSTIKNSLVKKAFRNSYNSEIFRMAGSSFILLIILPSLLGFINNVFIVFELLGGLLFFPILMTALRSYEDKSSFSVPTIGVILKKSWKVFVVNFIVSILIGLGSMLFIIPGIILWKRYIYVGLICEKELIGPLESMRKSKELAMKNGWKVFLREFYLLIAILFIAFISGLLSNSIGILFYLASSWLSYVVINCLVFYGYKEALD